MKLAIPLMLLLGAGNIPQAPATERLQAVVQSVDVPAGERLLLRAEARGVQIYRCDRRGDGAAWTFVAPEAKLFVQGTEVASHGAGPVWRNADGSAVWGEVLAKAPSTRADAIPQLLLKAVRTEGMGMFTVVNYIQRVDTDGGNAPLAGCDVGHAGEEVRTPYTATYLFYASEAGGK